MRIPSTGCISTSLLIILTESITASEKISTLSAATHYAEESLTRRRRLTGGALTREQNDQLLKEHLKLFEYAYEVQVIGPTHFPKPSDKARTDDLMMTEESDEIVPHLQPVAGRHRPDQDAVFAYAGEYPLSNYLTFILSLRKTGFEGDIVLSVSEYDRKDKDIWDFLSNEPGVVIYIPKIICYNFEQEVVDSIKGGARTCICPELFGLVKGNNARQTVKTDDETERRNVELNDTIPLPDPRPQRTIQNARYEIYWIMSQHYDPHSWILLVDARDTFFQSNPFSHVPRETDPSHESGLLYFYGENMEATRLGQSDSNKKWLLAAYGEAVFQALKDKPTICSGATMGEQVAMETYIRAMVAESDETGTVLRGADQGFHNYLFYSHKLKNAVTIHDIVVYDQGVGIVNNLGALRTKPLSDWGHGQIVQSVDSDKRDANTPALMVLNWDGTPSPVVHQFDRHKELSDFFYRTQTNTLRDEWRRKRVQK